MKTIHDLSQANQDFVHARDWEQFHTPKELAIYVMLEAAEVLELFQWKSKEDFEKYLRDNKEKVADELGDVLNCLLQLAHSVDIDVVEAAFNKLKKNIAKYPVEKAKGSAKKYNEYE